MEYQEAVTILKNLSEKYPFDTEEKDAVSIAIGLVVLAAQSKSRIKAQKAKRDKSMEWE